jgi:hypothetical protein
MAFGRLKLDTSSDMRFLSILLPSFIAVTVIAYFLRIRNRPGLRDVPGPWLASISSLDRIWSCATGLQMSYHLKLHKSYGPLVRIGPNHVSFSDASLIPVVYAIGTKFWKVSGLRSCATICLKGVLYDRVVVR